MRLALKILKWFGIVLGGLVGIIVVAMVVVYFVAGSKLNRTFDVEVADIPIPTDEAAIERGRHLVMTVGLCTECHGEKLQGKVLDEDPLFGRLVGRNLTSGKGGIGGDHTDIDFIRAIRHGVDHDGTALIIMPAEFFNKLGAEDIGAIVAYLRSVPPVDNEVPDTSLSGPMGRLFALLGDELLPANRIDHTLPPPTVPERGVTVEYGKYLALSCAACHGDDLAGDFGPNITQGGTPGRWSEADFISTLRTGTTPDGRNLDSEDMPWKSFARLTNDEIKAIWLYLKSVPPVSAK